MEGGGKGKVIWYAASPSGVFIFGTLNFPLISASYAFAHEYAHQLSNSMHGQGAMLRNAA